MYSDEHLASAEDEPVLRVLGAMCYTSEYDRNQHDQAAISRVRAQSHTADAAAAYAARQAQVFSDREQRRFVEELLNEIVTGDRQVSGQESSLLAVEKQALNRQP